MRAPASESAGRGAQDPHSARPQPRPSRSRPASVEPHTGASTEASDADSVQPRPRAQDSTSPTRERATPCRRMLKQKWSTAAGVSFVGRNKIGMIEDIDLLIADFEYCRPSPVGARPGCPYQFQSESLIE